MSAVWWVLLAYAMGVVASVRPFAKAEARNLPYYCEDWRAATSEPCAYDRTADPFGRHDRCGPCSARSIGATAIGYSLAWLPIVALWSALRLWDGAVWLVARGLAPSAVDQRRLAELERELGIGDE